jgi:hypothetical protein
MTDNFSMAVTIDREEQGLELIEDAEIEYHTEGKFRRATMYSPAEVPSIVIDKVWTYDNGTRELSEWQFTKSEWRRIENAASEDYESKQPDPAWDER